MILDPSRNKNGWNELVKQKLHVDDFALRADEMFSVDVVKPGIVSRTECRDDFSRFYPDLDDMDFVVGGTFK
jgi:hypothetical protein